MKKLIVLFIAIGAFAIYKKINTESVNKFTKMKLPEEKIVDGKIKEFESHVLSVKEVDTLKEDLENNPDLKTIADYEKIINENEKELERLDLIKKANSGSLSKEEAILLTLMMRKNIALNQIVADKKMKEFARKYL